MIVGVARPVALVWQVNRRCGAKVTLGASAAGSAGYSLTLVGARIEGGRVIGDDRPEAEVDGPAFGGYVKPANLRENCKDRRFRRNQSGKRKFVVVRGLFGAPVIPPEGGVSDPQGCKPS